MTMSSETSDDDNMSVDHSDEDEPLSLVDFRQKYDDLVKEMQELPDVDDPEDVIEQAKIISRNIKSGKVLMKQVGTNDQTKFQYTLKHVKVCMESTSRTCKRIGTSTKPFNVHQYLELLMVESVNSRDEYSESILMKNITVDMYKCTTGVSSFISLLGVVDLQVGLPIAAASKSRTVNRNKYALNESQLNATQHQIVNSKIQNGQQDEDDTVSVSKKMAAKLKQEIAAKNTNGLGLYEFGLRDGAKTTHDFLANVFGAAILARDGYAKFIQPTEEVAVNKRLPYADWKIKDAVPPPKSRKHTNNIQRFQQIISFNADTFKESSKL